MQYVIIAIVLVFLSIIGIGISKSFSQTNDKTPINSQQITDSSRSELDKMLGEVETKDAPAQKMGAMCYEVSVPPEYLEYVCPVDGEKTAYDRKNYNVYQIVENIIEMRRLLARINASTKLVTLSFDESKLCHKHSPNLKDDERFVSLVVTYPDKKIHVYDKVTFDDIRMLAAFFEKKLSYTADRDAEIPLKSNMDRIKKILGTTD